jgi:hypothetical protein
MKYLCLIYYNEAERDAIPAEEWEPLMREGFAHGDELRDRGVFLGGNALQPVRTAVTIRRKRGERSFTDGPFAETKELIAGFWLWQVRSREEAIEWLKRAPFREGEVEIRQVFEAEDFGEEFTPELREQEERVRQQAAARQHQSS